MIPDAMKNILEASIAADAPEQALFQARDIFEMVLIALQNAGGIPAVSFGSSADEQWVSEVFARNKIDDAISFQSLLGCADLLLNSSSIEHQFQARRLFQFLLNSISNSAPTSQ